MLVLRPLSSQPLAHSLLMAKISGPQAAHRPQVWLFVPLRMTLSVCRNRSGISLAAVRYHRSCSDHCMPKMRLLLTSLLSNRVRQILRMGRKQPVMSMGSRTRDDRDVSHVGSMVTGEVVERKPVMSMGSRTRDDRDVSHVG